MNCKPQEIGTKVVCTNLSIIAGNGWECMVSMRLNSSTAPIDLTDSVVMAYVMKNLGQPVLFQPQINMVDAPNGVFTISISESDSATLTPGVYDGDAAGQYFMLVNYTDVNDLTLSLFKAIIRSTAGLPLN